MADPFRDLDRHIARIDSLPGMAERAAPAVADALEEHVLGNVARGVGPDGKPWKPTEAGHVPLQNTAKDLDVGAVGPNVVAHLTGIHARHHLGAVKGRIARPILPTTDELPTPLERAIETVLADEFRATMGVG